MKRTHKGILLLIPGILSALVALGFLITGISSFVQQFETLARVESPGSTLVEIEEAGIHTLWHDYRTVYNRTPVSHDSKLPDGFTFTLVRNLDGQEFPLDPPHSTSTLSTASRDATAVGTFSPNLPGAYTLQASSAVGESRVFSLTEGSLLAGIGSLAGRIVLACMFGAAGLVLLVIGIVLLLTKPKFPPNPAQPSHAGSSFP